MRPLWAATGVLEGLLLYNSGGRLIARSACGPLRGGIGLNIRKDFWINILLILALVVLALVVFWSVKQSRLSSQAGSGGNCSITTFGAVGNGTMLNTAAIQKAIDYCHEHGGGVVRVPAGTFLTGTIVLKSNVMLHVQKGAEILGSRNLGNYIKVDPFIDGDGQPFGYCLIGADHATHIGIEGRGIIDGNGYGFTGNRPFLIRFAACSGVQVHDVALRQSAAWGLNLYQSLNVHISHIHIYSHANYNNDGIDIDSSQMVFISHCHINSEDDSICMKTTTQMACAHIYVSHCTLQSLCAAFKFGSESRGTFTDIHCTDCKFINCRLGGIKIMSVDGGHINNVRLDHIQMTNVDVPIFIRLGGRLATFHPDQKPLKPGAITNVVIRNVTATVAPESRLLFPTGIVISGYPQHSIGHVALENISMTLSGGGTADDEQVHVPERINAFPDIDMFSLYFPSYGMFARYVKSIYMENVHFTLTHPDLRPVVVCEHVGIIHWQNSPAPVFLQPKPTSEDTAPSAGNS